MKNNSHVRIFLDSIEVPVKIGLYDHEQEHPQRVIVDVALFADPKAYLAHISPQTIIDYSLLYNGIKQWEERPQVLLIEHYLKELAAMCFKHESVSACQISVKKADIFGTSQGAGVELFISREEWKNTLRP